MNSVSPDTLALQREIERGLDEAPFATLRSGGAPVVVAKAEPFSLVWASQAALALFGAIDLEELQARLVEMTDPGARRLLDLAATLLPAAPARLERLRFFVGGHAQTWTFLCRRSGDDPPLFFAAALGLRPQVGSPPERVTIPVKLAPAPEPREARWPSDEVADDHASAPRPVDAPLLSVVESPAVDGAGSPKIRSVADMRDVFAARYSGQQRLRFVWRSDAQDRAEMFGEDFIGVFGAAGAPSRGENLAAAIDRLGWDSAETLRKAIAAHASFHAIDIVAPLPDAAASLVVTFGALPAFDRERHFEGLRGFGVIHLDRLVERPMPPEVEVDAEESAALTPVLEESDAEVGASDAPPAVPVESSAAPVESPTEPPDSESRFSSPNVVRLRPHPGPARGVSADKPVSADASSPTPEPPVAADVAQELKAETTPDLSSEAPNSAPDASPVPKDSTSFALSAGERNAFREIARALGAKVKDDSKLPTERAATPSREPVPVVVAPSPDRERTVEEKRRETAEGLARIRDLLQIATAAPSPSPSPLIGANDQEATPRPDSVASDETASTERTADAGDAAPVDEPIEAPVVAEVVAPIAVAEQPTPQGAETAVTAEEESPPTALTVDPLSLGANADALFDRVPFGILVSRGGVPIFANRMLLDALGYQDVEALHAAGGVERMFRGREPEVLTREADGGAIPVIAAGGNVGAFEVRMQTLEWGGEPATLLTFRRAGESAAAQRARTLELDLRRRDGEARELHAILDTATDGVIVLDEEGRILALNRSGEALFGYEQNEIAGESLLSLLAAESHAAALEYLKGIKASGVASVLNDGREVIGRARQGGAIPMFMTLGRVSGGATPKFCAVLRDITHWKRAERELSDARRDAERASALKSDFLAKISHEIRTPLNAILGFAEVIMDERFGPVGNERYRDYLKDIHASGTHVMSLVNDLLDLSKIEAGKMDLNFGAVDVNKVVNECVSLMQAEAIRERVIVRLALAPRLPQVVADERSLRQIVLNLLSNALKFNEPGGQVIISTALTDAGHAVFRIKDTGIGMSDAEVEMALEPFRQVATSRQTSGTGLGLPLTKALVEANRASFTIKSKKNEGTLVEVSFPSMRVLAE